MSAVCPAAGIGFMPLPPLFFSDLPEKKTQNEKNEVSNK